ncbi:MAG: alginate lyase family protein, partial [Phycisphaerales bacterium]|nr:alginate lyase family protein [Phycisphaerales bacterium]
MLSKLKTIRAILSQYSLGDCLWRLRYNRRKARGQFERDFPAFAWADKSLSDSFTTARPQDAFGSFLFAPGELPAVEAAWRTNAIERADALIERGEFEYFSAPALRGTLGYPDVDWFVNPFTDQRDTNMAHWSRRGDFDPNRGDIKYLWEPSRFGWVYDLARAYAVSGDAKYPEAFWTLLESWMDANPPMLGPAWQCGQETAIRTFAICFGLWAFRPHPATTDERVERALGLLAFCGDRIASNIDYARRQHSNHSTSEAAGLYLLSTLLPTLKRAKEFRATAERELLYDATHHIKPDGSYLQHSLNYLRLAMHDFLWVVALAKANGQTLDPKLPAALRTSRDFLYQLQDETGRVVNYGANDGALLCPWSGCYYLDYRPMLGALSFALDNTRLYPPGPWDEEAMWFFGNDFLAAPATANPPARTSHQFSAGGYYTLRTSRAWAMLRCHTYRSRPAQADQLHLDLWVDGLNLLRDMGSFAYYDPPLKRNLKFSSTAMHNTVEIDGQNQMIKGPRFYWIRLSKGHVERADETSLRASHDGYARLGVGHTR